MPISPITSSGFFSSSMADVALWLGPYGVFCWRAIRVPGGTFRSRILLGWATIATAAVPSAELPAVCGHSRSLKVL